MKITTQQLKAAHACPEGVEYFRRTIGSDEWEGDWTPMHQAMMLADPEGRTYWGWAVRYSIIPAWSMAGWYLAGANLARAYLGGAYLARAYLAGAYLAGADLAGADLAGANLARADLDGAYLARAIASRYTRWPEGFDPSAAGVVIR